MARKGVSSAPAPLLSDISGDDDPLDELVSDEVVAEDGGLEVVAYRRPLGHQLKEAWQDRRVGYALLSQSFTFKMRGTILGFWWIPITIVFNAVAMNFIFGRILNVPSAPGVPYFIFVTTGTMCWWMFRRGTLYTMKSFHRYRRYVLSFHFPLMLIPVAALGPLVLQLAVYVVFLDGLFVAYWAATGELYLNVSPELVLFPVGLAWLMLVAVIVGLFTAPIYYRARDVRFLFRLLLPFWMFVTPIVYPLSSLSGAAGVAVRLNPLAPPVELIKRGLIGEGPVPLYSLASAGAVTGALLLGGLFFVNRYSSALLASGRETEEDDEI